jgi:hypothetical protein
MAVMIGRSKTKGRVRSPGTRDIDSPAPGTGTGSFTLRTSPYQRIILGVSLSDISLSLALLSGPFLVPADAPKAEWGQGNVFTCRLNGLLFVLGSMSTSMYMFFLCYFCLYKVSKNMTDEVFSKKIEWKFHAFILATNVIVGVAALVTKTLNSSDRANFCVFEAVPSGCRLNPEKYGACDEDILRSADILVFLVSFALNLLCFLGIIICMAKISCYVIKRSASEKDSNFPSLRPTTSRPDAARNQSLGAKIIVHRRQILVQSSLYVLAYFTTNLCPWIIIIVVIITKNDVGQVVVLFASILYPLGGLFNILVYTRPKVIGLRMKQPELSWFRTFARVVKAGGVVPLVVSEDEANGHHCSDCTFSNHHPVDLRAEDQHCSRLQIYDLQK